MSANGNEDDCRLGFLTAIEVPDRGYVGGLLVTNRFGRPLEFQCTTPVKPNRTQEILYGPTLVPFILGELIGRTLVEKVGVKPHLLLTEQADVLEVRNHVSIPVAFLDEQSAAANDTGESEESDAHWLKSTAVADNRGDQTTPGRRKLRFHSAHRSDWQQIETKVATLPSEVDLSEPFERVREALEETTRSGAAR